MATFQMTNRLTQTSPQFPLSMLYMHVPSVKGRPSDKFYLITQPGEPHLAMIAQDLPAMNSGNPFWLVLTGSGTVKQSIATFDGVTFDEVYEGDILTMVHWDKFGYLTVDKAMYFVNSATFLPIDTNQFDLLVKISNSVSKVMHGDESSWVKYCIDPVIQTSESPSLPEIAFVNNLKIADDWKDRLFGIKPFYGISVDHFLTMHEKWGGPDFYYGVLDLQTLVLEEISYGHGSPLPLVDPMYGLTETLFGPMYDQTNRLLVVFGKSDVTSSNAMFPIALFADTTFETWNIPDDQQDSDALVMTPRIMPLESAMVTFGNLSYIWAEHGLDNPDDQEADAIAEGHFPVREVFSIKFMIQQ